MVTVACPPCPAGFTAGAATCGLKESGKPDLALIRADRPAAAAGLFTRNRVRAAPVELSAGHLAASGGRARALIINAGIANAATGPAGDEAARRVAAAVAEAAACPVEEVLCNSTGVIGVPLPAGKIVAAIPGLAATCTRDGLAAAARAIMTTDTRPKTASFKGAGSVGGRTPPSACFEVAGIAKGSGMIHPDMATMIAVILTDAEIAPAELRAILVEACDRSFHRISVDGDTSTNDSVFALASGAAGAAPRAGLAAAITEVARSLAAQVVRDGEGATKFITVTATGAATQAEALAVARSVATSLLVRTAVAGGDPNWGRIVAAAGRSGVDLDPAALTVTAGKATLYRRGEAPPIEGSPFAGPDVEITIDLARGGASETFLSCDLTEGYVRINAEYTT